MDDANETSWQEVDRLFEAALDVPEDERSAFLERERSDPAVRARVERLLRAEAASRDMLEPSTVQRAFMHALADDLASGDPPPEAKLPDGGGERVGAYRLEEVVGHGGMATVYAARRVEGGFEQRVAIKLIRTDANTEELVRRFEGERAILSGLRHANIARLLDGGSTDDGVPYLAMDFVEGIPIDERARRERLDIEARLRLFLEVAGAVSYAHRNLVVHRDLKPSNILVDDGGHPMLLDFGIAKLLAEDGVAEGLTQTRARWVTPGYAAPEQIQGGAVTTATDVYQLGVLLFELLADRRPFEVDGRSTYEVERAICEEDPPRPSAVAPTSSRPEVAGDLDAIVLKAMRKEPEERYPSVEALAADIRRYLTAEPVEAHRGGWAYRARKFVRRHRGGVAAGAIVLLLLTAWAVTATVQGARIARERDRAELESDKATAVTTFLTSLLEAPDPRQAQGSDPTLRAILERGVERIGTELAAQPAVQAELYLTTGRVYDQLGDLEAADSLLTRAVEIRTELYGRGPNEELAEAQVVLGQLRIEQARFEEAEPLMATALEQRRALHPAGSEAIADDMLELGDAYRVLGRGSESMAMYEGAIEMYQALESPPRASIAITRNNMALLHHQAGRLADAMPLYERAVEELIDTVGTRHPWTLILQHNLAGFNRSLGRFAISDSIFAELNQMEREVNGRTPDLAASLANRGMTLRMRGYLDEADRLLTEAIEIQEELLDPTHPSLTLRMRNLANVRIDQGRYEEAEAILRDVARRAIERSGPDGETRPLQNIAIARREAGRLDESTVMLEDVLHRRREEFDPPHPAISDALIELGLTHAAAGRFDEAMDRFRSGLEMIRARDGQATSATELLTTMAEVALDAGRSEEAEAFLSEAEPSLASLPPGSSYAGRWGLQKARLLLARGDRSGALDALATVRPWYERQFAPDHPEREDLARVAADAGAALDGAGTG